VSAFQNTEKLPATRPDRMFSDAPPSWEAATTSFTWRECELVNTFVNSGITAAATVPHEMITESVTHRFPNAASGSRIREAANVTPIESSEHTQTRLVSGASKSILSLPVFWARATAPFATYDRIEVRIMSTRITKIHTRNVALCSGSTASAMNEMSATPVTP